MTDFINHFSNVDWPVILSMTAEHLFLCYYALVTGLTIGIIAGIALSFSDSASNVVKGLDRMVMTVPALAVGGIAYSISSSICVSVLMFLSIYTAVPVMRGCYNGARSSDHAALESCRAMGMPLIDQFLLILAPAFLPSFITGLRRAVNLVLGAAALSAVIMPAGLGVSLVNMKVSGMETVLIVSLILIALAMVLDLIFGGILFLIEKNNIGFKKI